MSQSRSVASSNLHTSSPISQIPFCVLKRQAAQFHGVFAKPAAETRGGQYLPMNRVQPISLLVCPSCKRTDMGRQRPLQRTRQHHAITDDVLHVDSLPLQQG